MHSRVDFTRSVMAVSRSNQVLALRDIQLMLICDALGNGLTFLKYLSILMNDQFSSAVTLAQRS